MISAFKRVFKRVFLKRTETLVDKQRLWLEELDRLIEEIATPGLRTLREMSKKITGKAAEPRTLTPAGTKGDRKHGPTTL